MNWLRRVMIGRYGVDPLGYGLIAASFLCMLLRGFFHRSFFGNLLSILAVILLAVCYLRIFSRNYEKRRMENERFLVLWHPVYRWLLGRKGAFEELQNYKHFKCPKCAKKIRIPRGRGKVAINCPQCGERFIKKT